MIDKHESNEEYWNARKAERQPMGRVGNVAILDEIGTALAKRVLRDAAEFGMAKGELDAMRQRMLKWHAACKAYQRDVSEVRRDCKDRHEMADVLKTMREQSDKLREGIFGD